MTLLSIKDDFLQHTLANVLGILGKLAYVSKLRENDRYAHWGLMRTYGEEVTRRALREVHRALFLQVLRTPLRQLVDDVVPSAEGRQLDPMDFVESLVKNSVSLLPPEPGGGSATHFNSIVTALFLLFAQAQLAAQAHRVNSV